MDKYLSVNCTNVEYVIWSRPVFVDLTQFIIAVSYRFHDEFREREFAGEQKSLADHGSSGQQIDQLPVTVFKNMNEDVCIKIEPRMACISHPIPL